MNWKNMSSTGSIWTIINVKQGKEFYPTLPPQCGTPYINGWWVGYDKTAANSGHIVTCGEYQKTDK